MDKKLLDFKGDTLHIIKVKDKTVFRFESTRTYTMITVSQKFLQEFIKLIDSRRFYKNFTKLNYEYNIAPQDFELYTLKKVLAIADNYHICRNEYSQICIVGRSEEFHMELDFADKILEVYNEIIKPHLTSDSALIGSSLFTK